MLAKAMKRSARGVGQCNVGRGCGGAIGRYGACAMVAIARSVGGWRASLARNRPKVLRESLAPRILDRARARARAGLSGRIVARAG